MELSLSLSMCTLYTQIEGVSLTFFSFALLLFKTTAFTNRDNGTFDARSDKMYEKKVETKVIINRAE